MPPSKDKTKKKPKDSLNGRLYDDAVVRGVDNLRYREDLVKRSSFLFRRHDKIFFDRIGGILIRMSKADLKRVGSSLNLNRATERTKALVDALRDFRKSSHDTAKFIASELSDLAYDETEYWRLRVNKHLPDVLGEDLTPLKRGDVQDVWRNTLVSGESINDMIKRWAKYRAEMLKSIIRQKAFEGLEASAIMEGLGGKKGLFARQVNKGGASLATKVRTAASASTSAGQKAFAAEHDLINDLVWVSVIDSRTSDICHGRHGKLVNKELGGALPPAHPNCRSITVPGVYNIARAKKLRKRLPNDGFDIEGRIPDHETAAQWLKRQPEEVQKKLLGPARFKAYKTGKYKWPDHFINREGRRWTLEELRKRHDGFPI